MIQLGCSSSFPTKLRLAFLGLVLLATSCGPFGGKQKESVLSRSIDGSVKVNASSSPKQTTPPDEDATGAAAPSSPEAAISVDVKCDSVSVAGDSTGLSVSSPQSRSVWQRGASNKATVHLVGVVTGSYLCLQFRVLPVAESGLDWQDFGKDDVAAGSFHKDFVLPARNGWYELRVRAIRDDGRVNELAVEKVGVGDVYVAAGQSNTTNTGQVLTTGVDLLSTLGAQNGWQQANDPMPPEMVEGSNRGSVWPTLGNSLVARSHVPVAIISVGWGGTAIADWQPNAALPAGCEVNDAACSNLKQQCPHFQEPCEAKDKLVKMNLYTRLKRVLQFFGPQGVKAVLWHQGESDVYLVQGQLYNQRTDIAKSYQDATVKLIDSIRSDIGWTVPWLVSHVSYLGPYLSRGQCMGYSQAIYGQPYPETATPYCNGLLEVMALVTDAQDKAIASRTAVFHGPNTDELRAEDGYRYCDQPGTDAGNCKEGDFGNLIHLSGKGQSETASRWLAAIAAAGL